MRINIDIPDTISDQIILQFAKEHGWTERVPKTEGEGDEPNPVTAQQYAKKALRKNLINPYIEIQGRQSYEDVKRQTKESIGE